MQQIITTITPGVADLIGLALTGIIAWLASIARSKWGIEISAKHREALHLAFHSAATLAMQNKLTGEKAIRLMLDYVQRSVPDAIINLKATPDVLADLAQAKLEQVVAEHRKESPVIGADELSQALRRVISG